MSDRQPLRATFFAFRRREEGGGVLLPLSLLYVAAMTLLWGGFVFAFRDSFGAAFSLAVQAVQAAESGVEPSFDPQQFSGLFAALGFLLPLMIVSYIIQAAFETGALRWLIYGERVGFLQFSFGAQTWRVWAVYWIWLGIRIVVAIAATIISFAFLVAAMGDPSTIAVGEAIAGLAEQAALVFIGIRFAPAAAASVAQRRFAFGDAWAVTRDRFWALFGSFFLICVITGAVVLTIFGTVFGLTFAQAWPDFLLAVERDDGEAVLAAFAGALSTPQAWTMLGVAGLLYTLVMLVSQVAFIGVNARAAIAAMDEEKISRAAV